MSFIKRVSSRSSLTEAQLESLLLYRSVLSGALTLEKASKMRTSRHGRPPTVGAYYRTVHQGKDNMKQAIMTVAAGVWLGYIKLEDLRRLFDLLANTPSPFENVQSEQLMPVLEALIAKIVM